MNYRMKRRTFLGASFMAGMAMTGLGSCNQSQGSGNSSQGGRLVAATYPGNWEDAHRSILVPAFKQARGADVTLVPLLAVDQVARLQASATNPPFDTAILDPGPLITAPKQDILQTFPANLSQHFADILPRYQGADTGNWGPIVGLQFVGIAYNPKKITTPPSSWKDLWLSQYRGRVGIPNMNSSLGTGWMVEIAKMNGGSETNIEPAFQAVEELLPNLAAVAANPGALSTLFQQGEVDIAPHNLSSIAVLQDKGIDVEWVIPREGSYAFGASMHVVKNPTSSVELATAYIDTALSTEVQTAMAEAPYYVAPVNRNAPLQGVLAEKIATNFDEYEKFIYQDWEMISQQRSQWIERFNREVTV
ncbi:extracellular solute-binding protein [Gloeocapsopsis sp. IPPAS B-1203]|uniref:extracellular solute-binding protein n=1 Tax=Gloeocapsopsis sp. IPPAS B-1203 TaxID=2049454 RepID=UPI000C174E8D|nr:extracellular solute-binding protein [Gloeocapsopsis sp. IPPAS B-1203]PIG92524.1 ABC transporter substrate-binding protein [Gloeocapsopsis sp. IPPAS B-1203]